MVTLHAEDGTKFSGIGSLFGLETGKTFSPWDHRTVEDLGRAVREALRRDGAEMGNMSATPIAFILGNLTLGLGRVLSSTELRGKTGHHFRLDPMSTPTKRAKLPKSAPKNTASSSSSVSADVDTGPTLTAPSKLLTAVSADTISVLPATVRKRARGMSNSEPPVPQLSESETVAQAGNVAISVDNGLALSSSRSGIVRALPAATLARMASLKKEWIPGIRASYEGVLSGLGFHIYSAMIAARGIV